MALDHLFDKYHHKEMMLVCLNLNGQETLLDLLNHIRKKERTDGNNYQHYNIPFKEPNDFYNDVRKHTHCDKILSTRLKVWLERVYDLEKFLSRRITSQYKKLVEGVFDNDLYPGIKTWNELWEYFSESVLTLLIYLQEQKVIGECKFKYKKIEIDNIIPNDSKYCLYKKYWKAINNHFGLVRNIVDFCVVKDDWLEQIPFTVQFTLDDYTGANGWVKKLGGFGSKKKLSFGDICLDSKFTELLYNSVKNIFEDGLGSFNQDRYLILLTMATRETVKIIGKKDGLTSCTYECDFKPVGRQRFSSDYKDFTSPRVLENWNRHKGDIEKFVRDLTSTNVCAKRTSWYYGSNIKTHTGIDKKSLGKWNIKEMAEVDTAMLMAQEKFNRETKDLQLYSMKPIWYKCTGNINYTFQLVVLSEGIRDIAMQLIPLVQSTILQIPSY